MHSMIACLTAAVAVVAAICLDRDNVRASLSDVVEVENNGHAQHLILHCRRFSNTCLKQQKFESSILGIDEFDQPFVLISTEKKILSTLPSSSVLFLPTHNTSGWICTH